MLINTGLRCEQPERHVRDQDKLQHRFEGVDLLRDGLLGNSQRQIQPSETN